MAKDVIWLPIQFHKEQLSRYMFFSLYEKILKDFDDNLLTGTILIGLQKTFDKIKHDMLSGKLSIIHLLDDTVKWLQSYVLNRHYLQQYLRKTFSIHLPILCN